MTGRCCVPSSSHLLTNQKIFQKNFSKIPKTTLISIIIKSLKISFTNTPQKTIIINTIFIHNQKLILIISKSALLNLNKIFIIKINKNPYHSTNSILIISPHKIFIIIINKFPILNLIKNFSKNFIIASLKTSYYNTIKTHYTTLLNII